MSQINDDGALACTYAALLLHDEGLPLTADNIKKIVGSVDVAMDPFWPGMFEGLLKTTKIEDLISNIGSGAAAAPVAVAAAGAGGAAAPAAASKKKEEPAEEEDEDMGFSLFD
eukprot:CAMPEP_0114548406 /NCGR_PEP_ID=MMETSP0114-20121206/4962_1 /TAXON_ID=31324 /ORGANISM="Goniomonas sp, Strain m" /LENGTH=112 /DNA_ID=CAMNT_0001732989 /DNA_START=50 /DNA_END=388 /DNA_ORIENTATION=+